MGAGAQAQTRAAPKRVPAAQPQADGPSPFSLGAELGPGGVITAYNRNAGPSAVLFYTSLRGGYEINDQWTAELVLRQWWLPANHALMLGVGARWEPSVLTFGRWFVDAAIGPGLSVFSYLRPRSELWVAEQFARLTEYHAAFRSCNRAFHQDPAHRLDHWCGTCDKCCFIDLVLAPFMDRSELSAVFGGHEPLQNPGTEERFRTLLDLGQGARPFECVGDVDECRAAVLSAAQRADRSGDELLGRLRDEVTREAPAAPVGVTALLVPQGGHHIPKRYAPADLLVRAR